MFLRLLFVLLSALNIAVGAWLLLGQPYARGGNPTDPGVAELRLLSEMPEADIRASTPATVVAPATAAEPEPSYSCVALGPFATPQDLRNARRALATQATRMRSRQEQASQANGWWVYLPAAGSRAQALEQARQLGAHHIGDYFVVSSGDQPNTISLGLFKDPANARKRRDEVAAAGFPARMSERSESVPEYWLDLVVADRGRFDWRSRVAASGIGSHSTGCF
ncbi:SPOR domain-containing protein [Rhodanobacter umsongensis]|uniref:SPOR domain-containing protein n=1 Tax=Rhodanobacter umsongensis TaxID=633153 RepID=A0ABW0JMG1_9GAMM